MSKEESLPIGGYAEKAYLEYSMYVILDRALPFVGDGLNRYRLNLGIQKNDNSIIINFRKAFTSSSIPPNPDEVETTQIPDSNIEIAADPEEHEEDKEDLAMVAESKLYKMVLKDLFEYLNR